MNDEIREAIMQFQTAIDFKEAPMPMNYSIDLENAKILLDYITNLQKENEAKEKVIIKQDYVINELEKWLINETEKLHNISGDNFTTVGQSVYQEILDKLKELKEGK